MKKTASFFAAAALLLCMFAPAAAIVEPSESFYVSDYAGILSSETEELIIGLNGALEQQCDGAQFVVVTVNSFDGMYSDEYATQVMNDWEVGDANANNGMALVYCPKSAKGWLTQGYGISRDFTDSDCESYLNSYFWDDADAGRYDEAFTQLAYAITAWYEGEYGASILPKSSSGTAGYGTARGEYYPPERSGVSPLTILLVLFLAYMVLSAPRRRRYYNTYGVWPALFFLSMRPPRPHRPPHRGNNNFNNHRRGGGGGGFGGFGGFGGGFGGGSGFGGGGFGSGGGGGRR